MNTPALIVVDIQNEYFPDGKLPLVGIEDAADNAALVIASARQNNHTIIHVRHEATTLDAPIFTPDSDGTKINDKVAPADSETVITKHFPNAFLETPLKEMLDDAGITDVTVIGAMSHMCIDATVRAAVDYGYTVRVVHDACTTLDLSFNDTKVPAAQAHATIMAAFEFLDVGLSDTQTWLTH